ncbi:short-chain dehydrogenase [Crepidotus variabilis]|uniref:Short-chain dehydrogenase n=1 Tax=Crepidotus variabilis TaxID=179855 RepID=A0A9P6E4H7_9AGAR|nr:short-chain dehydrogenase [Crepidotus variabilis]
MKPSLFKLIKHQFQKASPVLQVDLSGKHVLVVGANRGTGLDAAKHFATMNPAKLILACRNQNRGDAAATQIVRDTGFKGVETWLLDLADFASVTAFAERYEKDGRLDILVENAAVIPQKGQKMTKDGWELTLQTNNLAMSLLGILLLPRMLETAEKYQTLPRLVVVSSAMHYFGKLENRVTEAPNPLQVLGAQDYHDFRIADNRTKRYAETKILNVLFVRALAFHLKGKSIIVNAVDPSWCKSDIRDGSYTGIHVWINSILDAMFAISSEQGSRQLVWASVGQPPGEEEVDLNGKFITFGSVWEPSDYIVSEKGQKAQERLWEDLIEELAKVNPKVRQIVDQYLSS